MTVSQLSEHLKSMPPDAVVVNRDIDDGGIFWYYEVAALKVMQMVRLVEPESEWHEYYFNPEQPWPDNMPPNTTAPRSVVVIK